LEAESHVQSKKITVSNEVDWEPVRGVKITKYKGKFFEIDIGRLLNKIFK
jgi:hypothetical protein